jgi:MFS family permease
MAMAPAGVGDAVAPAEPPAAPAQPWPASWLAWYALILLTMATMMNFIDRAVFGLMVERIKNDFQLSDVQLGYLMGPAGVIFYLFVGIPLARLVDIYSRRVILALGMVVTNGITILGGLAQNYPQLFASRMLVGVGGSAHAPGTYSMLADYFNPKKLPLAFAVLQAGFIGGAVLGPIVGGRMLAHYTETGPSTLGSLVIRDWQWTLITIGVPGLLIALLVFFLREPPRRGRITKGQALPIGDVFREIHRRGAVYYPMFIGLALSALEAQGLQEWRVPFMKRTYGWDERMIGDWQGITALIAMPLGVIFGTALTTALGKRYKDSPLRVTAIVFALSTPFAIATPLMPTGELAMICGSMSAFFGLAAAVPQNTAVQTITPNEMRGQVTAVYLFMFTAVGAFGSVVVGYTTKYIIGNEAELWKSMALVAAVLMPIAAFAIWRGAKPYGEEIERMEREGKI